MECTRYVIVKRQQVKVINKRQGCTSRSTLQNQFAPKGPLVCGIRSLCVSLNVRPRAPDQHARMVERRGAVLRHAMHCIQEQLQREGLQVTMQDLLAEAVFAGNSLISYNGATPYNARFGHP